MISKGGASDGSVTAACRHCGRTIWGMGDYMGWVHADTWVHACDTSTRYPTAAPEPDIVDELVDLSGWTMWDMSEFGWGADQRGIAKRAADEIVRLREAVKFLDYMDTACRIGDPRSVIFAAFVWGQRREALLCGDETFDQQNLPAPTLGGSQIVVPAPPEDPEMDW